MAKREPLLKRDKPPLNPDQLAALMRLKPTLEDTAAFFQVNSRTIERYIKESFGITFTEFRAQNMAHTRHALVRKAIEKALAGDNCMLIFCLKNMCGWADKLEHSGSEDKPPITLSYTTKKLKDAILLGGQNSDTVSRSSSIDASVSAVRSDDNTLADEGDSRD